MLPSTTVTTPVPRCTHISASISDLPLHFCLLSHLICLHLSLLADVRASAVEMGNQSSSSATTSRRSSVDALSVYEKARKPPSSKRGSASKFTFPASSPRASQTAHTITVQQRRPSQPLPQLSPLHITNDVFSSAAAEEAVDDNTSRAPRLPVDKFEALVAAQMLAVSQRREAELQNAREAQLNLSTPAQRDQTGRRRSLRISPDITPHLSPEISPKSSAHSSPLSSPPLSSRMNALHISTLSPQETPVASPTHAGAASSPGASAPPTPSRRHSLKPSRRWSAFTAPPKSIATAQFTSHLDNYSVAELAHPSHSTLASLWLYYQPVPHSDILGFTALLALATDVRSRVMRHRAEEELRANERTSDSAGWEGREWDWLPGYEHETASGSVQCVLREVCRQLDVNHDGNVRRAEFESRFGGMLVGVLTKKEREREHRRRKREKQVAAGTVGGSSSKGGRCSIM